MFILTQAPFVDRANFGSYLNEVNLTGLGVEIGTHRGEFAATLLATWTGKLVCIDSWESGYDGGDPISRSDRIEDQQMCRDTLESYRERVRILVSKNEDVVNSFPDNSLDFVYIDANHKLDYVMMDLDNWWPKLKVGGLLAGHDIVCPGEVNGGHAQGVQPAVFNFANLHTLTVHLVVELTCLPWSFYMVKE